MLISKFHRLIQSRVLWGFFLVVIIFSFVIWGMRTPGQNRKAREANAAGKLEGKFISQEEFRDAYVNTYMAAVLAVGRPFDVTKKLDDDIREAAWRRIAALREAAALNLTTGNEEVRATIQAHPGFQVEGHFNQAAYAQFVQGTLAAMGFTGPQFEEHVRQEITLQKLQRMVQQAVLISPYDVHRTYHSLSDAFDIQYVTLSDKDFAKDVKVSREEAHTFFLGDPKAFTIPEKATVKYIQVPVSNFLASAVVTNEDDALAYYDEHISEYTVTSRIDVAASSTNSATADSNRLAKTDAASTSKSISTSKVVTLDFDRVKTNILHELTVQAARDRAADIATDFVVTLTPDRDGNAPTFDEAAAKAKLEVKKAGPFALKEAIPGVDAGPLFNMTAFALSKSSEEYFSDAIPGSNFVYVLALEEKTPSRVPEFDEVAGEAMDKAREHAVTELLAKKAQEIHDAATKAVEKGDSFEKAVQEFGFTPKKIPEFTVAKGFETNDYADILMRGILPRNQGEVTDLLTADDGTVVIAFIEKRIPSDAAGLEGLKPQIVETVRRQRSRYLFEDWERYLLDQGSFVDMAKRDVVPDEDVTETNAVPGEEGYDDTNAVPSDKDAADDAAPQPAEDHSQYQ